MSKKAYGFTIVELLIAIVVIAILAAISIVSYANISSRANDTAVQSDLQSLARKLSAYEAMNGSYPVQGSNSGAMPGGIKHAINRQAYSDGVNVYYCVVPSGTNARFALAAKSKSGEVFTYRGGSLQSYSGQFNTGDVICSNMGMPNSETGYEYHYGRNTNSAWSSWTNG